MILHFFAGAKSEDVGFYSGLLEGAFHLGCIPGAILWSVVADRYGRRSALLWGLFGTVVSCLAFGTAQSFTVALLARFAWGLLNGNVGVAKTVMSELVPDSQMARAFSYIGLNAGLGRMLGPAIGGLLSEPNLKYGWDVPLFKAFPFLLPCLIAAVLALLVFLSTYFFLGETLGIMKEDAQISSAAASQTPSSLGCTPAHEEEDNEKEERDTTGLMEKGQSIVGSSKTLVDESVVESFQRLCKDPPVFSAVGLYALLGMVGILSQELYPLYVINGKDRGGFSLTSSDLGSLNAACGPPILLFQLFLFERATKWLGVLKLQSFFLLIFTALLLVTPFQSLALGYSQWTVTTVIYTHFILLSFVRVQAFTINFVVVANSALPMDRAKVFVFATMCV